MACSAWTRLGEGLPFQILFIRHGLAEIVLSADQLFLFFVACYAELRITIVHNENLIASCPVHIVAGLADDLVLMRSLCASHGEQVAGQLEACLVKRMAVGAFEIGLVKVTLFT